VCACDGRLYVLVSDDDFTAEQVLADLPEPDELANSGVFNIDGTKFAEDRISPCPCSPWCTPACRIKYFESLYVVWNFLIVLFKHRSEKSNFYSVLLDTALAVLLTNLA